MGVRKMSAADMDDIPDTGTGVHGRLLATEIRVAGLTRDQKQLEEKLSRYDSRLERLFWVVLAGSLGVMTTVVGGAIYIGGQFQTIRDLDRRVTRIEDRPTLSSTHRSPQ